MFINEHRTLFILLLSEISLGKQRTLYGRLYPS